LLESVVNDKDFARLMQRNIQELIIHFFEKEQNFGILCKLESIVFDPPLPKEINAEFRPLTLFFLAGYTFETAKIQKDVLVFEAGFGSENFGSVVSVPLNSIMQIIIDETPVLINLANPELETIPEKKNELGGVENSMASFLSNPENAKFLKNKGPKK